MSNQMPPWLQEQIVKMQQSQQNLQGIMTQRQHLEIEGAEIQKALDELKKSGDSDPVYKYAGTIMIRSTKPELISELEERQEMAKTRETVLQKQEDRLKETLKEQEAKITEMMKGGAEKPEPDNPRK